MTDQQTPLQIVKIPSTITVKKFAELLGVPVSAVITELLRNKIMATINEEIDYETASIIADDLGFKTEEDLEVAQTETLTLEKLLEITKKEQGQDKKLIVRPPIVTILGHVDHGKTTLLDPIRKTSVAAGEAGGITQHISAYQAKKRGKVITFIDTPGHEAFSAMRERGVSLADIAILVVAADDSVQPQTKEVITYIKERNIPTIVAINKIDKPEANVMRVKKELAEQGILIEGWGGKVLCNEIIAKNNIGISDLLESILLLSEVENFRADEKRDGLAVVLESHLDPQKGPLATILVKTGALKVGQDIAVGKTYGRIRRMEDYAGKNVERATPSMPIVLFGLNEVPQTNDVVQVVSGKSFARAKSQELAQRLAGAKSKTAHATEDDTVPKLPIVLKADVQGSLEAIDQILATYQSEKVFLVYVAAGIGNITESDVKMAQSAGAAVYGFNVSATPVAKRLAESGAVNIKIYTIIYQLVDEIKKQLLALLPTETIRTDLGTLTVLALFRTEKERMIIGGRVTKGHIAIGANLDVVRGERVIGTGKLSKVQHNKIDVNEVKQDKECGLTFEGATKIKVGDLLMCYTEEEQPKML